jgi:acetylornithine deacetylase/succinyl-diaminopimelate desuccinylase-like protein
MERARNGRALAHLRARRAAHVQDLEQLVRFRTVSSEPACASEVANAARWLAERLRRAGLKEVSVHAGRRHPLVYGEWLGAPGRPTVLVYGHYDVQPVEPVTAWRTPPFEPTRRGSRLYGRGTSDDKGQLLTHVHAIEALLATGGRLPVNVRCVFEGEEEIGSQTLQELIRRRGSKRWADVAVISDTRMLGPGRPALTYALRGSFSMEIEVRGEREDLHAGHYGGGVPGAIEALCQIVASLHDRQGNVTIPGFYDRVRARRGPFSPKDRMTIRPALTINGIGGGDQGPGPKAVLPARAFAKLNVRLVPYQDPREVAARVRRHIERAAPAWARVTVGGGEGGTPPVVLPREHAAMRVAAEAYRRGFGRAPEFIRSGGTIPVVEALWTARRIPTVLMGFAHPSDAAHAPNESFHLPNLERGAITSIHFLTGMGSVPTTAAPPKPPRSAISAPSRAA